MRRLKAHLLAFLMALIFGVAAYAVVHGGLKLHRWVDQESLPVHKVPRVSHFLVDAGLS